MINTKSLDHAVEVAEQRLDDMRKRVEMNITALPVDPLHEIGALYNLLITLGKAVQELQRNENR